MEILKKVKNATRSWHDRMEEVALSDKIAAGTLSLPEYKAVILGHYVFHQAAEQRLQQQEKLSAVAGLDLEARLKTPLLAQDVHQLGLEHYVFDFNPDISLDTVSEALGCMYVMEGATLGGTVIGRSLQKVSEITDSGAMHYYGCYGEQTGRHWKRFKEVVEQQVVTEAQEAAFVESATATFRAYAACMEKAFQMIQATSEDA